MRDERQLLSAEDVEHLGEVGEPGLRIDRNLHDRRIVGAGIAGRRQRRADVAWRSRDRLRR